MGNYCPGMDSLMDQLSAGVIALWELAGAPQPGGPGLSWTEWTLLPCPAWGCSLVFPSGMPLGKMVCRGGEPGWGHALFGAPLSLYKMKGRQLW